MPRFDAVQGAYHGTSDDVAGRWYIVDREADYIDKRGRGYPTKALAIEAANLHVSNECMSRGHFDANGTGDWHCIHERCACLPLETESPFAEPLPSHPWDAACDRAPRCPEHWLVAPAGDTGWPTVAEGG
jgi:hypothetical protein